MLRIAIAAAAAHAAAPPTTMRQVRTTGPCAAPFVDCVHLRMVAVPKVGHGVALIRVNATSVNPSDVDEVEGGACTVGRCGADVSGTVVQCDDCSRINVGDEVWTLGTGAYSDYVAVAETSIGLKPSISHLEAGTIPEVGLTSLMSLKRTASEPGTPLPKGSPWTKGNLTVVITAGAGGTGSIGIQLAKAWGAAHIATSASGDASINFVKSLGATYVVDYKQVDLFGTLPDDSVDIVYDNYGAEGTADKAMHAIRPGGTYLLLPHGECFTKKTQGPPCLSANPKPGVRQLNYATGEEFEAFALEALDELAALVRSGGLRATVDRSFSLEDAALAFNYSAGSGAGGVSDHVGKISITVS
jgi:NADPH:quinone reductase-like Zn-dependent oxidoreductase